MKLAYLNIGDTVNVKTWSGMIVVGTVLTLEEDVQHARPGITYRNIESKQNLWCYDTQITGVLKRLDQGMYA